MKITIKTDDKIDRLDKFLHERLSDLSRSFIQKQIKDGEVTVNGKNTNSHYQPSVGDVIEIEKTEPRVLSVAPNQEVKFKIIDEAPDYAVIEKPAGLVVHPAPGVKEATLADGLIYKYPELKNVGEDKLRPGIVHRLDRDVSGLMVVSRTQKMFEHLKSQFKEKKIAKQYTALVHGIIEEEEGVIDTPIGRSKTKSGKMSAHTEEFEGDKQAKTEYRVLERVKNYTLLRVIIHTGRSHQIRVHMNSIQHPIVGDALYTNKRVKQIDLGRLFLHASRLGFTDLSGEWREYESKLPKKLQTFLSSF